MYIMYWRIYNGWDNEDIKFECLDYPEHSIERLYALNCLRCNESVRFFI